MIKKYSVKAWNLLILISTSFVAIFIPLDTIFGFEPTWVHYIIDLVGGIFLADIVVSIVNAKKDTTASLFEDEDSLSVYLRYWLILDIIAIIPFKYLAYNPFFQLFMLVKIFKALRIMSRFRHYEVKRATELAICYLLIWLIHISHWISCAWIYISGIRPEFDATSNYIRALYWSVTTLTTVGYGDITPDQYNNTQMIFTIFVEILGVAVYGYVIGNVAGIISKTDPAKAQYQHNIEKLTALIQYRQLPISLQGKIRDYYTYLWKKRMGFNEMDFLEGLPDHLQKEVSLHLKKEIINKIPLFQFCTDDFVKEISMHLVPEVVTPEDRVFSYGDEGKEMYFVVKGELQVLSGDSGKEIDRLYEGDFFGEIALFLDATRSATIKAVTYCDLYKLRKVHFERIVHRYPEIGAQIKAQAKIRKDRDD
ncbi:cyclic nucleotide-binding domain-containing protein [Flammeovirgaceae bacterium SG7u.111]|nr:cyclic nucleotide-binding domain-containing protein [Flammeovirgaceae bacterium SG7u.132]WPO33750.1 cyclic nucleotide-binding domain-containing protein [Flammeovirgaceae bacterium SG7u.111]